MSPGTLYQYLSDQVASTHTSSMARLEAIAEKAAQADDLASKLMSNGIPAIANGLVQTSQIMVWVSAYVERIEHIDIALTRLALRVESRSPRCLDQHSVEIHVQGYPMPLYVSETTPDTAPVRWVTA